MGMKRCESGHYYDTGKNVVCPLCSVVDPLPKPQKEGPPIIPRQAGELRPSDPPAGNPAAGGKTVAVMKKEKGIDPVVGWLVCTKGPDRGVDYRIKGEKNFIGRAPTMDICIAHDETISRENHAGLSYNPKKKSFKILPGEGRGLVYLNGEEVDSPKDLVRGDIVEIGQSALMFVPLCGEDFDWE